MHLSNRKFAVLFSAVSAMSLMVACGDSDEAPDARPDPGPIDGAPIDADTTPDAGPDAAPPSFSGTVSIQEVTIANLPMLGSGVQVSATFQDDLKAKVPVLGVAHSDPTKPGTMTDGCFVTELTKAEAMVATLDEGAIDITSTGTLKMPQCKFDENPPGPSYKCIASTALNKDITIVDDSQAGGTIPAGTALVTIADGAFTADDKGRYLVVVNPGVTSFTFPIVANGAAANQLIVAAPTLAANVPTFTGIASVLAGVGPAPVGGGNPATLADADMVTVTKAAGTNMPAFNETVGAGDAFELDAASQTTITDIPMDGTAFSIGCDAANSKCGSSLGTVLVITTTDTAPAAGNPTDMPLPTNKRVSIRCAQIGANTMTVPAVVSEYIKNSGAKRIQVTYLRSNLKQPGTTGKVTTVVVGHGVTGFTDVQ